MVRGKEQIIKWYVFNKAPIWCICSAANSTQIIIGHGANVDKEDDEAGSAKVSIDPAEALEQLQQALDILTPGRYIIKCRNSNEKGNKWNRVEAIDTTDEKTGAPAAVGAFPIQGGITKDYMQTMIDSAVAKVEHEHTIKDMQRQIAELKKGPAEDRLTPGVEKFLTVLTPHVGKIVESLFGANGQPQVAVSGFGNPPKQKVNAPGEETAFEEVPVNEALATRAEAAAEKLYSRLPGDEEARTALLEKLASIDQSKLEMALNFL